MAGTMSATTDWDALSSVLSDTTFGHVWLVRLALMILIFGAVSLRSTSSASVHRDVGAPLLAGLLLASLAGVGHTQQNDGLAWLIHLSADSVHLLGAGAWLGGLLALGFVLAPNYARPASDPSATEHVLHRFSGMGYVAVAVLIASGAINSWYLVGSFAGLATTTYGQLLLAKLSLFAGMLALAASNRFWLVPALHRERQTIGPHDLLTRLRRHVLGEVILGLLVILIVSFLGTMEPSVNQMTEKTGAQHRASLAGSNCSVGSARVPSSSCARS
jgi:putative copper resistance protein D